MSGCSSFVAVLKMSIISMQYHYNKTYWGCNIWQPGGTLSLVVIKTTANCTNLNSN